MMELDEQLFDVNPFAQDFFDHGVFSTFDVHFEQVDPIVPLQAHRRGQAHDGQTHRVPPKLSRWNNRVRDPVFPGRQIKGFVPVVASDTDGVKMKLRRQGLREKPRFDF
ncbi:MAG: hypothetical protein WAN32_13030, partial [Candidatus Acidiferrum sp.]